MSRIPSELITGLMQVVEGLTGEQRDAASIAVTQIPRLAKHLGDFLADFSLFDELYAERMDHNAAVAAGTRDPGTALERQSDSVKDGAQIMVSLAHRVGWVRVSQLLGLGNDGDWLKNQFDPISYQLRDGANKTVASAAYLLGQYARHYCTEHQFDTLNDAIDNVVRQVWAKK